MLILQRKQLETICIDGLDIQVTVISIDVNKVTIQIDALRYPKIDNRTITLPYSKSVSLGAKDVHIMSVSAIKRQVKIGFDAPRNVSIDRKEIYLRKERDQLAKEMA